MQKLRSVLETLHSSLWFIPTLIVAAAVALAAGLVEADRVIGHERLLRQWPRLFGVGADGARGMLSAIAGSMITVAGVTFSTTLVALALASSQYTSRILRNFLRDRATQTVLGVFVGVFVYCLVVLRTIRGGDEGVFVPSLAVLVAALLALIAVGFLIFFIHHISASIQAANIIESVTAETLRAVDHLFPDDVGVEAASSMRDADRLQQTTWWAIPSRSTGYVQSIDADALFDLAREHEIVVRMEKAIGEFVIEEAALVSVAGQAASAEIIRKLNAAFTVNSHRNVQQDAAYGIRQIVDVALKALSPSINDTTTAVNCIDYLGAILARLAARRIEPPRRSDGAKLRLIARGPSFPELLAEAFDQIRQNADGNVAILTRMLQTLRTVGDRTLDGRRRAALRLQVHLVTDTAQRSVPSDHDRAEILAISSGTTEALQADPFRRHGRSA